MDEKEFLKEAKMAISALIVDNRSIHLGLNDLDYPKDITDMKNTIQKFYGALSNKYGKVIETKNSTIQNAINEFYNEADSYSKSEKSDCKDVYDAFKKAVIAIENGVSVVKNSDFFKNLKNEEAYHLRKQIFPEKENNVMGEDKLGPGPCLFRAADEFLKLKNWLESIGIIIGDQPREIGQMGTRVTEISTELKKKYGEAVNGIDSAANAFLEQYKKSLSSGDYADTYNTFAQFSELVKAFIREVESPHSFEESQEKEDNVNIMNKDKLLKSAASKFRLESARFDSTVNKFHAAFPGKEFKYKKITWDENDNNINQDEKFTKFSDLISNMVRLIKYMQENVNKNNGDTTPVVAAKKNVETAVNNLIKALKEGTEDVTKKENEYLNTIVNNTASANQNTLMSFESFEILNSEKKKVKGREEKEDGTFKRIVRKFKKRKDGDKEKKKDIKQLNVKKVMEPNASNEKMISLTLKDDNAVKCLEHMNEKFKSLIKRCRYIFPGREYKEAKSFVEMRALLSEIYEVSERLIGKKPDTKIFSGFDDALNKYGKTPKTPENSKDSKDSEDSNGIGNITGAFDEVFDIVLEVAKRAAKLGKKADQELQKSLEPIFEKKILTRLSKEEEKDGAVKNFNNMYKEFKSAAKKISPKWYKFMETMCSKNKIKNPTNGALMALLLISCCAADDISKADAICRAIRKIIKNPALKDKKYMKEAENIRQDIKNKILVVNDIGSLYNQVGNSGYSELVDTTLFNTIITEVQNVQIKSKKKKIFN